MLLIVHYGPSHFSLMVPQWPSQPYELVDGTIFSITVFHDGTMWAITTISSILWYHIHHQNLT